jgi:hypothetical protein
VTQAGPQAFEHGPVFDILRVVDHVIRFSVRNGPGVRMSIDETLRAQTGEALISPALDNFLHFGHNLHDWFAYVILIS